MSTLVFAAVLLAALLHAAWNALVKGGADKHMTMLAVVVGHVPPSLLLLPFVPLPAIDCLPWLIGGILLHLAYQLFLVAGYKIGDLTQVYPIARGSAPLIVAAVSVGAMGVTLSRGEWAGVLLIAAGIISIALVRRSDGTHNPRAVAMALMTGIFIASYSLVDGIGARLAGNALSFWIFSAVGTAALFVAFTAATQPGMLGQLRRNRRVLRAGLIGGAASFLAYALVIWAFTQAPIALVTALRETSIIFALLIGVGVLRERLNLGKVLSTMVTIAGAALLRLSRS